MVGAAAMERRRRGFRPEGLGDFLEAAYCLDGDDQVWLETTMRSAQSVWGRGGPGNGVLYDASDPSQFRVGSIQFIDCSPNDVQVLMTGLSLQTPAMIRRTYLRIAAGCMSGLRLPELEPMLKGMGALGYPDALNVNGMDPTGVGIYFALWGPERTNLSRGELALYRRMAHHLGAAYRCRRRLRAEQAGNPDPTLGAEAILDARHRVLHAVGPACELNAQRDLQEAAAARDQARHRQSDGPVGLERWRPLTGQRWTLVDSFTRSGTRYVVARENRPEVRGLAALTERERQVVAYLAMGQSTKEAAYALGISDVTVRVLLRRAASKLGVRSRDSLLAHHEVRQLNAATELRGAG
jgi:DNA-binding CsgD family transcriptional regulator